MKSLYDFLIKRGQLVAIILGILFVLGGMFSLTGLNQEKFAVEGDLVKIVKDARVDDLSDPPSDEQIALRDDLTSIFTPTVASPISLIVLALLCILIFGVVGLVTDFKGSMKFLIGFGILVGLFAILSLTSSAEETGKLAETMEKFDISNGVSQLVSGGIKTALICGAVAAVGAFVMEIYNIFK